jgi:hypothetical protein
LSAKEIKIQIDSNDLFKLVGGIVNSDNFRKFAEQIVKRTAMKYGTYNNPYHPEDNIVENFDTENAAIEAHLEEENNNFISGGEDRSDDQLSEGETTKNYVIFGKPTGQKSVHANENTAKLDNITPSRNQQDVIAENDGKDKIIQRRYVLKHSN